MDEDPVVSEALRRLPREEVDLRLWRLKRALDLSMKKNILPKEQWTSEEEVASISITASLKHSPSAHTHTLEVRELRRPFPSPFPPSIIKGSGDRLLLSHVLLSYGLHAYLLLHTYCTCMYIYTYIFLVSWLLCFHTCRTSCI